MKNIKLTKNQWERLSEILGNLGLLVLGAVVIPYFFDKADILGAIRGLYITGVLWYLSLIAARKYSLWINYQFFTLPWQLRL